MDRFRVESRTIAAIGYDLAAGVLEVEFHDGSVYQYDVPHAMYEGLLDAKSHSKYLRDHIRDVYPFRKIR